MAESDGCGEGVAQPEDDCQSDARHAVLEQKDAVCRAAFSNCARARRGRTCGPGAQPCSYSSARIASVRDTDVYRGNAFSGGLRHALLRHSPSLGGSGRQDAHISFHAPDSKTYHHAGKVRGTRLDWFDHGASRRDGQLFDPLCRRRHAPLLSGFECALQRHRNHIPGAAGLWLLLQSPGGVAKALDPYRPGIRIRLGRDRCRPSGLHT